MKIVAVTDLDYTPTVDGNPADPEVVGGSVDTLQLFTTADRTTPPAVTAGPASRVRATVYRFQFAAASVGRYWPRVTYVPAAGQPQVVDDLPLVDLPILPDLAVSPEQLATRLQVPLPITTPQRDALLEALYDAQDDVESHLGRAILPRVVTQRRAWPSGGRWQLTEQPVLDVLSEVEEVDSAGHPTGYWTVTYRAGLDARNDPQLRPILAVLRAHAMNKPAAVRLWRTVGGGAGADGKRVQSLGAEGQSVSYTYLTPSGGTAGAAVTPGTVGGPVEWSQIDRWRLAGRRAASV